MPQQAEYFILPYLICNDGAGSATLQPCQSLADAKAAEEAEREPFAESTARCLELKTEAGKLFFRDFSHNLGTWVWVPVSNH